jgi:hypothetical protein
MPKLEYFLVCRAASVDFHSDEVTLSGVLEDIDLGDDGYAVVPQAVAVGLWNLTKADEHTDFQAVLRIIRPGEEKGNHFPVNLVKGPHRIRAVFAIQGIPLEKPGDLVFELLLNTEHAAEHKVIVHESSDAARQESKFPKPANHSPSSG